jgi:phosphoribosylaminoimidazole-succinocarboxamide synthase
MSCVRGTTASSLPCLLSFAGSTDTSLWTHYSNGARSYCGNTFPDGMRKNDRLTVNVITPTTKAEDHDVPIRCGSRGQWGG